jgi:hypothetical protein
MGISINPGSGPVDGATEEHATDNIKCLITDVAIDADWVRVPQHDSDGRFGYVLFHRETYHYNNRCCFVRMPGIPLSQVRFMDELNQDIWDFSRLYINESSWVWKFAISSVISALAEDSDEGEDKE